MSLTDHDGHRFLATLTDLPGEPVELERLHRYGPTPRTAFAARSRRAFKTSRSATSTTTPCGWLRYRLLHTAARLAFHAHPRRRDDQHHPAPSAADRCPGATPNERLTFPRERPRRPPNPQSLSHIHTNPGTTLTARRHELHARSGLEGGRGACGLPEVVSAVGAPFSVPAAAALHASAGGMRPPEVPIRWMYVGGVRAGGSRARPPGLGATG